MKKKTQKDWIKEAADAKSDLNIFAAVAAIMEGGTLSTDSQDDEFKFVAMSQRAQKRCLTRYDRAMDALGYPYGRPARAVPEKQGAE